MIRTIPAAGAVLTAVLLAISSSSPAAEIARFDDGPLAGKGYPFSESARLGDTLYLSGQVGEDGSGELVPGGIQAETEQVMINIEAALARRGLRMEHIVKCTVFLADIAEWGVFNEIYKKHFSPPYPARSALGANGLALNARVELECIAGFPDEGSAG
jgi:reactive intermediate/imine deaminase